MATYESEEQLAADGIRIVPEPERHRYAVYRAQDGGERQIGEAGYTLLGSDAVDFNHTLVIPEFRGTGVAELLAQRALTGDIASGRTIHASCSYIRLYLRRHPELQH